MHNMHNLHNTHTNRRDWNRSTMGNSSLSFQVLLLSVGMASFFAGTLYTMHAGINNCQTQTHDPLLSSSRIVEEMAQKRVRELQASLPHCKPEKSQPSPLHLDPHRKRQLQMPPIEENIKANVKGNAHANANNNEAPLSFPSTMDKYLVGMSRTPKLDFVDFMDLGVPIDLPKEHNGGGDSDVLLLYQRSNALPSRYHSEYSEPIPYFEQAKEALEHCDYVNVVLTDHGNARNQCWAIVPQYESFQVQKWMRLPDEESMEGVKAKRRNENNPNRKPNQSILDSSVPLRLVGRGAKNNGGDDFSPPLTKDMRHNWNILQTYFASFPDALDELKPLVEKVATPQKSVTVMVCNFGQSELLANFVCASKSRGLDTSSIIVFATDVETKNLAEHLGLTAFYDRWNFGSMPKEAARQYGDRRFTAMMMAKVFCVHMVSALRYHVLFQDVDIVWYKDPLRYFETQHLDFDMMFQDDGGHSIRYAPYSANTGFYYVRYNTRTEYFLNTLLLSGDLIQKTDSHQQALIALLSDHSSLYGLKVKVFSRDDDEFPGGFQYHQRAAYMRDLFAGKVHPYIFHMSWTLNKKDKLLFLKQMGEWFVNDVCVQKTVPEILGGNAAAAAAVAVADDQARSKFASTCCAIQPLISCHYRDKPSVIPCKDSPPIDAGRASFWK